MFCFGMERPSPGQRHADIIDKTAARARTSRRIGTGRRLIFAPCWVCRWRPAPASFRAWSRSAWFSKLRSRISPSRFRNTFWPKVKRHESAGRHVSASTAAWSGPCVATEAAHSVTDDLDKPARPGSLTHTRAASQGQTSQLGRPEPSHGAVMPFTGQLSTVTSPSVTDDL